MIILFLIVAILGTLVIVKLNSPEYKGKTGEKLVAERLEIIDGYKHILNDIMLNDNGKSRQIDHIAITEYGVYIIETKNYAGTIYGRETSNEWQQYLNGKCFKFKNPIHQNYGHLQVVNYYIDDITQEIYSVIAFIRRGKLKIDTTTPVIYEDQLAQYIRNHKKVLNSEKIEKIYQTLIENQITNVQTIKDHNYNVKRYKEYKQSLAENEICPRCNSKLIKRTGKNGTFYGCSNFPKCHYTKNIEEKQEVGV